MKNFNERDTTAAKEIVSSRVFKIGRDLLFNAWSDPQFLARWWGPKGFTNTFHEFDFRQGETGNLHSTVPKAENIPIIVASWRLSCLKG